MYEQREKLINKYLKVSVFIVPVAFGAYPSMHFESAAKRFLWIFIGIIGATILLIPLMWISLKHFYVYEDRIVIKGLLYKKQYLYENIIKCFFRVSTETICLYMADREVKLHIGTYISSKDIVDNLSRYVSVKEV